MIALAVCPTCTRSATTYAGAPVCVSCDAPPAVCPCRRPDPAPGAEPVHAGPCCDRDTTIAAIRAALRRRTGRAWSVTGGRGTSWGWIRVDAPPARRTWSHRLPDGLPDRPEHYEAFDSGIPGRSMSPADRAELGRALGLDGPAGWQGESIPAGHDYRIEYVDRAEGRIPSRVGVPYWD